jgi:hypothetical protein
MEDDPVTARVLLEDESEAEEHCTICGEPLDYRDLTQLLHHRAPAHAPFATP